MLLIAFLSFVCTIAAKEPLSQAEALKQIYNNYDAKTETAQWICTEKQHKTGPHEGWPCDAENAPVSVDVLMMAEVNNEIFVVASATPANSPSRFECHGCAPAIGVGVFVWQGHQWELKSANTAVGFYGGWGDPPNIDLVTVGPEKHGVLLSMEDMAQGYSSSTKVLFMPLGKMVSEVWKIDDEQDDYGAYDPTDKYGPKVRYRSWASFRFTSTHDEKGQFREFYDIEVSSRGRDPKGPKMTLRSENWMETYRFKDGKYRLMSHHDFVEVKKTRTRSAK
jgi:hypothetical protein